MSQQRYIMTDKQIQELKELDIPYCPSVFNHYHGNFKRYCGYMRLHDNRDYRFSDSEWLEKWFQKFYADPIVKRLSLIKWDGEKIIDLYEEIKKND
jgi:hypothetical protein